MKVDKKPPPKEVKKASEVVDSKYHLIKTINENEEVEDLSEESDVEVDVRFVHLYLVLAYFGNPFLVAVSTHQTEEPEKG